jgi:hypothetical protein
MQRFHTSLLLLGLSVLTLGACGDRDVDARQSATAEVGAGGEASQNAARGSNDRFEVTLDRPPFEGPHQVSGDMGCMMYNGIWQATYEARGAEGLSQMLVQIKEVPAAGGSTDKLTLSVMFGQVDDLGGTAALIDVHGSEFERDGRGTVTREGRGAVLRIEGTAANDARVTAVLRCASVDMMG